MTLGGLVATGRTSDVFHYGPGAVVKVPRPDTPGHWSEMEASFTDAVRSLGLPVAEVKGMVDIDGRPSVVFELIEGPSMWDVMVGDPDAAPSLGAELADVHRAIHGAGLPPDIPGLVERLRRKVGEVREFSDIERDEARAMIESLPCGAALLHGDLHPGNVLMSGSGPVVIDWFDASIGHPVADVVRSSMLMRPAHGLSAREHLPGADPSVLRRALERYLEAMADVLDVDERLLHAWETVTAASRLAEGVEEDRLEMLAAWRARRRDALPRP